MTETTGIRRLDNTIHRMGGRGDNWHTTWAADDKLYTAMSDSTSHRTGRANASLLQWNWRWMANRSARWRKRC